MKAYIRDLSTNKMRVVALVSGGKDSCYNIIQCVAEGHELVALANLRPVGKDELDSYMFQTVGHNAIELYSEAMDLPLFRRDIKGSSLVQDKDYLPQSGDEVEDLYSLLKQIKEEMSVEAVSVGAILSNYQRVRVENVCGRLGLTSLGYLWRRDQKELLQEMISAQVEAIIIKVAALGLTKKHLNMTLREIQPHMLTMSEKYQLNPCGEGGEYETFMLDCPLFNKRIVIDEYDVIKHDDDPFSPVYYLNFKQLHLEAKDIDTAVCFKDRIKDLPIKRGSNLLQELSNLKGQEILAKREVEDQPLPEIQTVTTDAKDMLQVCIKKSAQGYISICGILCKGDSCTSEATMNMLKGLLDENGYSLQDVVMMHLFVKDMTKFGAINQVYKNSFMLNPPARACVEVCLPEDVLFQVDCLAHRQPITEEPVHRHVMHVQGISHWAPANIGPYSQATQIGNLVNCAGMIGLCPSSMKLVDGGIQNETVLSLRSVQRVLRAMERSLTLFDVIIAVCYVTQVDYIPLARTHWRHFLKDNEVEEIGPAPMTCFVVVPNLPKQGSVEWQVTAAIGKKNWDGDCSSTQADGLSVHADLAYDQRSGNCYCLASVAISPSFQSIELSSCTNCLVFCTSDLFRRCGFTWSDAFILRVFYVSHAVLHQAVCSALKTSISSQTDDGPPISAVPVKGLSPGCIMEVIIQLQHIPQCYSDDDP